MCIYVYIYIHMCMSMYVHTYLQLYIHIYIYTHTYRCLFSIEALAISSPPGISISKLGLPPLISALGRHGDAHGLRLVRLTSMKQNPKCHDYCIKRASGSTGLIVDSSESAALNCSSRFWRSLCRDRVQGFCTSVIISIDLGKKPLLQPLLQHAKH